MFLAFDAKCGRAPDFDKPDEIVIVNMAHVTAVTIRRYDIGTEVVYHKIEFNLNNDYMLDYIISDPTSTVIMAKIMGLT